jgi:hypothetical protein
MNRQFLTIVLIFASISSIGQECFACDGDPTAIISGSYYKYVSRDEVLGFSGSNSHDNDQGEGSYCIVDYDWVWPSAAYDIWESLDAGKTASAKFDTTGEHLVRLYVKDDEYNWSSSDTCKVRVVEVSLSASSGYIPAGGVLVPINLSVSPTDNWSYCKVRLAVVGDYQSCIKIWKDESKQELVIGDGSYYEEWQPGDLPSTLYVEGVSPTPPGADVDLFLKYLHYYGEVSQSSGNHVDFVVVGVGKVVDENSDEGPLYVCIDDSVNLEAIPNPYDASFPAGQPVWSIVGEPNESTASISPASGVTTTLSGLTVAGNYEIKAACGTSYDLITVTALRSCLKQSLQSLMIEAELSLA